MCLGVLTVVVDASAVIDICRLVHADIEGRTIGSAHPRILSYATLPLSEAKLFRAVVVSPLQLITAEKLTGLLQRKSGIEGFLLVLPRDYDKGTLSAEDAENLRSIELAVLEVPPERPLYFAVENDALTELIQATTAMFNRRQPPTSTTDRFVLDVAGIAPKEIKGGSFSNFIGWLSAQEGKGLGKSEAPTIALVASYDTFSLAPALPSGADSNGSGLAVLLYLLYRFRQLYQSAETRGQYNLLFIASSGGPLGFEGTRQWLGDTEPTFLETLEFSLCLDSLAPAPPGQPGAEAGDLYLHYSKPAKEPDVAKWYSAVASASELAGLMLTESQKKVNVTSTHVAWEHEHFSKRRLLAATLSGKSTPPPYLLRSGLEDQLARVDLDALARVASVAENAIGRLIYPGASPSLDLSSDAKGGCRRFLAQWLGFAASAPRQIPYLTEDGKFTAALGKFFKENSDSATRHSWKLGNEFRFFNGTTNTLTIYRSSSFMYDMYMLLGVIVYLSLLFVTLRISTRGWDDFVALFRVTAPKKYKRN